MQSDLSDLGLDELLHVFLEILMRPRTELSEQDQRDIAAIDAAIFKKQKAARA